jgi:hypothetical protein
MKMYRCVFTNAQGHTSMEVTAESPKLAAFMALDQRKTSGFKSLEVFDGERLAYVKPMSDPLPLVRP